MGPLFYPQLLETFEQDAIEHLSACDRRSQVAKPARLGGKRMP